MTNFRNQFPLVQDNESVVEPVKSMELYEEEDLITNIHGSYHEKNYSDVVEEITLDRGDQFYGKSSFSQKEAIKDAGKSYAELAREAARDDVKRKKQAYFDMDKKIPSKPVFKKQLEASLPKKSASKSFGDLKVLADKLKQENYIIAELPRTYTEPKNEPVKKGQKNSYDFLKKSQIYNPREKQIRAGHTVAQEFNLTRLD